MIDIFEELSQTEEMYDNNLEQLQEIEKKNIRLTAEMCLVIKKSKNEIIKMINDNEDYLKMNPHISEYIDIFLQQISYDEINDISKAKIIIEILKEIKEHDKSIEEQQMRQIDNNQTFTNTRGLWNIFNKIADEVREDLQNGN